MKQYIYIPFAHEAILTAAITQWVAAEGAWIIIQGVYKSGAFVAGNSTVFAVMRDGTHVAIKKSVTDFEGQNKTIMGFGLEGNVQELAPEDYAILMQLQGVEAFDNADDYREFINSL
jgi:hypothetical protein